MANKYAKYVPEWDYAETDYAPRGKTGDFDLCGSCIIYYKELHDRGLTSKSFPPSCNKHVLEPILKGYVSRKDFDSDEEFNSLRVAMDPVSWAQSEFGWMPRWYQENVLSCTASKIILRWGRRTGKTVSMAIKLLHHVATHKNHTCLVISPFMRQVEVIFDEVNKHINDSATLRGSIARQTKNPQRMELKNGSKILGFSVGASSGAGSDQVRGQDANLMIIDEMDYLRDSDLTAVLAILASHPDCKLIVSSTPVGWRKKFYSFCTDKNLGFKEFWLTASEAPNWSGGFEEFARGSTTEAEFQHEYNAEFAESEEGVFRRDLIDESLEDYDMESIQCRPEHGIYVLGVDWNKSAGTHMVILEWTNKLILTRKIIVPESEYIQTDSVKKIIDLNDQWRFKYIFVDAGYGSTQVEMLKKHGTSNPGTGLQNKVKEIHMNQHLEMLDPTSGKTIRKPAKPFLVQQTVKLLEDGNLILPVCEDTASMSNKVFGLVQQMRNYIVEAYSVYGLPRYSQGQEHTLTAYILACGGFILEAGDLKTQDFIAVVKYAGTFGEKGWDAEKEKKERDDQVKKVFQDTPRSLESGGLFHKGMGDIRRGQEDRKNLRKEIGKSPNKAITKYIGRNTLGQFKRKDF